MREVESVLEVEPSHTGHETGAMSAWTPAGAVATGRSREIQNCFSRKGSDRYVDRNEKTQCCI